MPHYEIRAEPIQAWSIELRGGDGVQFNGRLMAECMSEALQCANLNGCLEPGAVGLTDACAETLTSHAGLTGCAESGFGIRVKAATPGTPPVPTTGPGVPRPGGGATSDTGVDWLPGE